MSRAGDTVLQTPRSIASRRTIQRRNRLSRLHALPPTGAGRNSRRPGRFGIRPYAAVEIRLQRASGKRVERRPDVGGAWIVAGHEEALDRSRFAQHPLQDQQQRHQVASADPAMHERIDAGAMRARVERADEGRRRRAHHGHQRFDRLQHARDAAERQRRGAEADHLLVLRRRVAADDLDRIGGGVRVIETAVEILESIANSSCRRRRGGQKCLSLPATPVTETAVDSAP